MPAERVYQGLSDYRSLCKFQAYGNVMSINLSIS